MLLELILCLPLGSSDLAVAAPPYTILTQRAFATRLEEAGDDLDKLWDLYLWCEAGEHTKDGRRALRKILRLNPEHKRANEAAGHTLHDGKWFRSKKELENHKRKEAQAEAKEKGLVRYKGEWVSPEEKANYELGLVRSADGLWVTKEERERLDGGWVHQDLQWVSPEEVAFVEQGKWKCADEWLEIEQANEFHAKFGQWWQIPTKHFLLYTTCDRSAVADMMTHIDRTHSDLVRIYGRAPAKKPIVVVLRDLEQYKAYANGNNTDRRPTDALGRSSIHYSFFGDMSFDPETKEFLGAGVSYWDATSAAGKLYGKHSVRHAAGQSFAELMDPSQASDDGGKRGKKKRKKSSDRKKGRQDMPPALRAFYEDKLVPEWFRFGAAGYVERYFIDSLVESGGNPNWPRDWSLSNISRNGGLRSLEDFFSFELDVTKEMDSTKLLNEAGLVMSFIVDGDVPELKKKHGAVCKAIAEGDGHQPAFQALKTALLRHEDELRAFASF